MMMVVMGVCMHVCTCVHARVCVCVSAGSCFQEELDAVLLRGRGTDHVYSLPSPPSFGRLPFPAQPGCPQATGEGRRWRWRGKHLGKTDSRQSPCFFVSAHGLSLGHSVPIASASVIISHRET